MTSRLSIILTGSLRRLVEACSRVSAAAAREIAGAGEGQGQQWWAKRS